MIRKSLVLVPLVALTLLLGACKNPQQDLAAGVLAFQGAVIADGVSGNLSPKDEGAILKALLQLEAAISAQATGGTSAAIKSAWDSALKDIPQSDQTKYAVLIAAITGAVNAL
jgi:hypothetical protein